MDIAGILVDRRLTAEGACYTISSKLKSPGKPDCYADARPQNWVASFRWWQAAVGRPSDVSESQATKIKEVSRC